MGKKIFVVDDDPDMVKVMSFRLKSKGFEITSITQGAEALKRIQSEHPALVLLDVQMPDMTGHEIVAEMDKDEATKSIPVIYLTGKVDFDSSIANQPNRAMFIKPCDFDALTAKITEMTGG